MASIIRTGSRQVAAPAADQARGQQYLTFTVSGEAFAIPIASIREIIEYRVPTDVPMMPPFIRGVINLRGRVVPVIDLAVRFGREKAAVSKRTCIVILEIRQQEAEQEMGVVVDAVSAVVDIADSDIEPPPSFGSRLRADFISGMGKINEKFIIILNIDHVISVEELSALAGVGPADIPALPGVGLGENKA
jgi:purine-binding chemotaxis protein CheW